MSVTMERAPINNAAFALFTVDPCSPRALPFGFSARLVRAFESASPWWAGAGAPSAPNVLAAPKGAECAFL